MGPTLWWPLVMARGQHVNYSSGAWTIPSNFQYRLCADTANAIVHVANAFAEEEAPPGTAAATPHIIDLGAGTGHYVHFFRLHGLHATGVEGAPHIEQYTNGAVRQLNLAEPLNADACALAAADWVSCLEVAEHIPVEKAQALLQNINCIARLGVVISWAQPGQFGSGHINLRSKAWVRERFAALDFVVDVNATRVVSGSSKESPYIARNVLVFRRPSRLRALPFFSGQVRALPYVAKRLRAAGIDGWADTSAEAARSAEDNATSVLRMETMSILSRSAAMHPEAWYNRSKTRARHHGRGQAAAVSVTI